MEKRTTQSQLPILIISITVIFLIILGAFLVPEENIRLTASPIFSLNDHWYITTPSITDEAISLPIKYDDIEANEFYTITHTFNENIIDDITLRFRLSMQFITVKLDDDIVFEYLPKSNLGYQSPDSSLWQFVTLPGNVQGKTLSVTLMSRVEAFAGTINPIYYGEKGALMYDIINNNFLGILSSLILIIISIIMLLASIAVNTKKDSRMLYLGLFSLTMSFWLFSEMRLMQFITNSSFILGGINYMLLPMMPVYFILYLREVTLKKYTKIICWHNIVYFTLLIVNFILQGLGLVHFIESVVVVDTFLLVSTALIVTLLLREYLTYKNLDSKRMLQYMSLLVVMVIIEIIQFYSRNYFSISSYVRIGFSIFFMLLAFDSMRYFNSLIAKEQEITFLQHLAYQDILTGGPNRLAYEQDLEAILNNPDNHSICLVLMDLNNLKQINDQFGHKEGDYALRTAYNHITDAFGMIATNYRLGGDEFVSIIQNPKNDACHNAIYTLRTSLHDLQKDLNYELQLAIGWGVYHLKNDPKYSDYSTFFHEVDQLMYIDKNRLKNET